MSRQPLSSYIKGVSIRGVDFLRIPDLESLTVPHGGHRHQSVFSRSRTLVAGTPGSQVKDFQKFSKGGMSRQIKHFYEFGPFRLAPEDHLLLRDGKVVVDLTPKQFDLLLALVSQSGRVLSKDDLMKTVWPETHVGEANVTVTLAALRKALSKEPGGEQLIIETISKRGYRFVLPVTERSIQESEPTTERSGQTAEGKAATPPSAGEMVNHSRDGIGGVALRPPGTKPVPGKGRALKWSLVVTALASLLLGSWAAYHFVTVGRRRSGAASGPATVPRSIAVLGFRNLSADQRLSWLSPALAEWFSSELAAGGHLRTVPNEDAALTEKEVPNSETHSLRRETVVQIGKSLGVDLVVLGSYSALGPANNREIRVDVRIEDTRTGDTIISAAEAGEESDLYRVVAGLGEELRVGLGIGEITPKEATATRATLPSNARVLHLYAEGLLKMRRGDALGARGALEQAVRLEPQFPLVHFALADALSALGYDAKAREEAKKAVGRSANLSREEQLSIEARYREMTYDWPGAVEIYRSLWTLFPNNLEYGLRLAKAQASSGDGTGALRTVLELRQLPKPAGEDPQIDLAEASAAGVLADFRKQADAAARAAAKSRVSGRESLEARALISQGNALHRLGRLQEASTQLHEAEELCVSLRELNCVAETESGIASLLVDTHSDRERAQTLYGQALVTYRKIGNRGGEADALRNIGILSKRDGDRTAAQRHYEAALTICRETGDKLCQAAVLKDIANLLPTPAALVKWDEALSLFREAHNKLGIAVSLDDLAAASDWLGNLAGARKLFDEEVALERQIGAKPKLAFALVNSGEALADTGDLKQADERYTEALNLSQQLGVVPYAAWALKDLAEIDYLEGNLAEAKTKFDNADRLLKTAGRADVFGHDPLVIPEVLLELGHPEDALSASRRTASEMRASGADDQAVTADLFSTQVLLRLRRGVEARQAAERLGRFGNRPWDRGVLLRQRVMLARIRAGVGNQREAVSELRSALAEAKRLGYARWELDARLALAQMEISSKGVSKSPAEFGRLEKDAEAKGFELIARRAATSVPEHRIQSPEVASTLGEPRR
jgi:eukaryotic-like serine/threonine-protein kinase